jgi:undecaprenyl-diphosphatase
VDNALFDAINDDFEPRTLWAHSAMKLYANDGIVLFALLLLCGFLLARHRRDITGVATSLWTGAAALIALAIAQVLGTLVDRARPYDSMTNVHLLVHRTTDFSFPSDHATVVGAVATGLLFVDRRLGFVAAVAAAMMAFTRVYVGAHYPFDVLAGLALGAGVAMLGRTLVVPLLSRVVGRVGASSFGWIVEAPDRNHVPVGG